MKLVFLFALIFILPLSLSNADYLVNHCGPIKIAVIDTGLDLNDPRFKDHLCKDGHKNFVPYETLDDINGHGTHVAGLVENNAGNGNYCILIYKYFSHENTNNENAMNEIKAIKEAVTNGADIVNFSGGGETFSEEEALLIQYNPRVTFVVAAGNEKKDLDIPGNEYYPASLFYNNMYVIEAIDAEGNKIASSNYGSRVKKELGDNVLSYAPNGRKAYMTGTSMATAIFSGKLVAKALKSCKYR